MTATENIKTEYSVTLGDQDFYVTVKRYPQDGSYNAGQTWVDVEEHIYNPAMPNIRGFNNLIFNQHVESGMTDLDAMREAFKGVRSRMKTIVQHWSDNRYWATLEKGGKRGYYTKHANYWHGSIAPAAANWKLCKLIWKQITKL